MMRFTLTFIYVPAFFLLAGCDTAPPETESAGAVSHDEHAHEPAAAGATHDHHAAEAEHEALPLRPIMLQLAADLAAFTHAVWLEDYEEMIARSAAMADHTHISAEEIARIEAELGPEMAAFEEADEAVHVASMRLSEAAEARQLDDILGHLSEVQRGCVACHTQFRERLRTDDAARPAP